MVKLISEIYPELVIHDVGITFTGGAADVTPEQAEALRALPEHLGVRQVHQAAHPETKRAGRRGGTVRDS